VRVAERVAKRAIFSLEGYVFAFQARGFVARIFVDAYV
jgi:hypothetical protein